MGESFEVPTVDLVRAANSVAADLLPGPVWWPDPFGVGVVRCQCGVAFMLRGPWLRSEDGSFDPPVFHNDPACGWHVRVRLLDWEPSSEGVS